MTQSAVSRQIKHLEDVLGQPLFERHRQRLLITETGAQYARQIRGIISQLEDATRLASRDLHGRLKVGIEPALTTRWLIPRLGLFNQRHPHISIDVLNDLDQLYDRQHGFDIGILYGDGKWPNYRSHFLMPETMLAVCTPELRQRHGTIDDFGDLLHFPILHDTSYHSSTRTWLQAAGLNDEDIEALPGQRFEHFHLLLDAALQGLGLTVLPSYFVAKEIEQGTLVEAGKIRLDCRHAYHVIIPEAQIHEERIGAFLAFLLEQAVDASPCPAERG